MQKLLLAINQFVMTMFVPTTGKAVASIVYLIGTPETLTAVRNHSPGVSATGCELLKKRIISSAVPVLALIRSKLVRVGKGKPFRATSVTSAVASLISNCARTALVGTTNR